MLRRLYRMESGEGEEFEEITRVGRALRWGKPLVELRGDGDRGRCVR